MRNTTLLAIVIAVIVIALAAWVLPKKTPVTVTVSPTPTVASIDETAAPSAAPAESSTPSPSSLTIHIKDSRFQTSSLHIQAGQTVTWINDDSIAHMVDSDPHPSHTILSALQSPQIESGQSYSITFTKTGTFPYHCHLHPSMKGTIVVE